MSAHTPGPWEVIDNAVVGPKIDEKPIWLRPVILRSETGISEANARLIAAAPDLLIALRFFVEHPGVSQLCTDTSIAMSNARAAIRKATGE